MASLRKRIYLDWAATAPMAKMAVEAAAEAARAWANPSSIHREGRAANAMLENARIELLGALGGTGTLIFTSGASEALSIALSRVRAKTRIISAVEHTAVSGAAPDAWVVPVDANGRIDLDALSALLTRAAAPSLVAVMQANNETGVVQPLAEVAALAKAADALLLVDAVQGIGKLPWPDADFVAVSSHKLGGPPGIGALIVGDPANLEGVGVAQERGYRAGTQNLPGAVGWAAAMKALAADHDWTGRTQDLRRKLETRLVAFGGIVAGSQVERLPNITCIAMPGVDAMRQLMLFDLEGFAISAGAACSSGRVLKSHVLDAMGWGTMAGEAIRVSLGWNTTEADVIAFSDAWETAASRLSKQRAA